MVDYIIQFLLNNRANASAIGYCSDENQWSKYKVVIVDSGFFSSSNYGKEVSIPQLPLQQLCRDDRNLPILFGSPKIEKKGDTIICYADIVASAFYFISRYEEFVFPNTNRDEHGRYIGTKSLLYQAGLIERAIVDEYGDLLCSLLKEAAIEGEGKNENDAESRKKVDTGKVSNIYLTHDVDFITNYRHIRGFGGGIKNAILHKTDSISSVIKSNFNIFYDRAFTFDWIAEQDNKITDAHKIFFIKSAVKADKLDYYNYNLKGKDFKFLCNYIYKNIPNATLGLHASYYSGAHPTIIADERKKLESALADNEVKYNRHHYLRALQPDDMMALIDADITDDFTMGFADIAGFRLGTCRAVKFINPRTQQLTALVLHPLTIMDCTLSNSNYMNLNYDEALEYSKRLINTVRQHNGEVVLLWHNTIFSDKTNYHKQLYSNLIDKLNG